MDDFCQIPVELRKRVGDNNITSEKCLQLPNTCWDKTPFNNAPNCFKNLKPSNCDKINKNDVNVGENCYKEIWNKAGCLTNPPQYDLSKKKQTYHQLVKSTEKVAKSLDDFHLKRCYGDQRNKINYCSSNYNPKCDSSYNTEGDIIFCSKCLPDNAENKNYWVVKDNRKIKLDSCDCPAAIKYANIEDTVNSDVCGNPIFVDKTILRYHQKEAPCIGAWEGCTTSEECCKGRQCRKGDKRCLTEEEFTWSNFINKTNKDGTIITREPINTKKKEKLKDNLYCKVKVDQCLSNKKIPENEWFYAEDYAEKKITSLKQCKNENWKKKCQANNVSYKIENLPKGSCMIKVDECPGDKNVPIGKWFLNNRYDGESSLMDIKQCEGTNWKNKCQTNKIHYKIQDNTFRKDKEIGKYLEKYQTKKHLSDCELVDKWNDKNIKWYYSGEGIVNGLVNDNQMFYIDDQSVHLLPTGQKCEISCGQSKINLCEEFNHKIKNCKLNRLQCETDKSIQKKNSFTPKDITPNCFYSIPIESGDGEDYDLNYQGKKTKFKSMICSKSDYYNPKLIDCILNISSSEIIIFIGDSLYKLKKKKNSDASDNTLFFKVLQGYPKLINSVFPGIPDKNIDGAIKLNIGSDDYYLFFKQKFYYMYDIKNNILINKGLIENVWLNAPDNIDSVFYLELDNKLCFVKGGTIYNVNLNYIEGPVELPSKNNLFVCDGPEKTGLNQVKSLNEAKDFCTEFGGVLADKSDLLYLQNTLRHKENTIKESDQSKCLQKNSELCNWANWNQLYNKCQLYKDSEINKLSGETDINNFCKKTKKIKKSLHKTDIIDLKRKIWVDGYDKPLFWDSKKKEFHLCDHSKCSTLMTGAVLCKVSPNNFILGGILDNLSKMESVFPNSPIHIDCLFYTSDKNHDEEFYLIKHDKIYNYKNIGSTYRSLNIISNYFEGLPKLIDHRKENNKKICHQQYKLGNKLNDITSNYSDTTSIISRGYESLSKLINYGKELEKDYNQRETDLKKQGNSLNTKTRFETMQLNSSYKYGVYNFIFVVSLISFFLVLISFILKKNNIFDKKVIGILVFIISTIGFIIIFLALRKLSRGNPNRYSLIQWKCDPNDKVEGQFCKSESSGNWEPLDEGKQEIDINIDLKRECQKIKQQDLLNKKKTIEKQHKEFFYIKNFTLNKDGIEIINNNPLLENKKIGNIVDAKQYSKLILYCDGFYKCDKDESYQLYKLKTKVDLLLIPKVGCEIFLKRNSTLGKNFDPQILKTISSQENVDNSIKHISKCPSAYPYPFSGSDPTYSGKGLFCCSHELNDSNKTCMEGAYQRCDDPPCLHADLKKV